MPEGSKMVRTEKREYPRIKANCPIRYQTDNAHEWQDATLLDYSATGVLFACDELILTGTKIKIELVPDSLQKIPRISAKGVVNRLSMDDGCNFQISCEFLTVVRSVIENIKDKASTY